MLINASTPHRLSDCWTAVLQHFILSLSDFESLINHHQLLCECNFTAIKIITRLNYELIKQTLVPKKYRISFFINHLANVTVKSESQSYSFNFNILEIVAYVWWVWRLLQQRSLKCPKMATVAFFFFTNYLKFSIGSVKRCRLNKQKEKKDFTDWCVATQIWRFFTKIHLSFKCLFAASKKLNRVVHNLEEMNRKGRYCLVCAICEEFDTFTPVKTLLFLYRLNQRDC